MPKPLMVASCPVLQSCYFFPLVLPPLLLRGGTGSAQPSCYLLHPATITLMPHFSLILLKTVKTNKHFNTPRPSEAAIKLPLKVDV